MPRRSKNKALASSSRSMCDRWEVGRIVSGWRPTHREAILWRVCSRGVQASAFYCTDHLNVPNVFCLWFGFYPASSTMMVMPASHLPPEDYVPVYSLELWTRKYNRGTYDSWRLIWPGGVFNPTLPKSLQTEKNQSRLRKGIIHFLEHSTSIFNIKCGRCSIYVWWLSNFWFPPQYLAQNWAHSNTWLPFSLAPYYLSVFTSVISLNPHNKAHDTNRRSYCDIICLKQ